MEKMSKSTEIVSSRANYFVKIIFFKTLFAKRSSFFISSGSLQAYWIYEKALMESEKGLKKLEIGIKIFLNLKLQN